MREEREDSFIQSFLACHKNPLFFSFRPLRFSFFLSFSLSFFLSVFLCLHLSLYLSVYLCFLYLFLCLSLVCLSISLCASISLLLFFSRSVTWVRISPFLFCFSFLSFPLFFLIPIGRHLHKERKRKRRKKKEQTSQEERSTQKCTYTAEDFLEKDERKDFSSSSSLFSLYKSTDLLLPSLCFSYSSWRSRREDSFLLSLSFHIVCLIYRLLL